MGLVYETKTIFLLLLLSTEILYSRNINSSHVCYIDSLQYYNSYIEEYPMHLLLRSTLLQSSHNSMVRSGSVG